MRGWPRRQDRGPIQRSRPSVSDVVTTSIGIVGVLEVLVVDARFDDGAQARVGVDCGTLSGRRPTARRTCPAGRCRSPYLTPDAGHVLDTLGRRVPGIGGTVDGADRGAEDAVGADAAPDQLLEHADLHRTAAATAREHERRARLRRGVPIEPVACAPATREPRPQPLGHRPVAGPSSCCRAAHRHSWLSGSSGHCAASLLALPPGLTSSHVVAHGPHDDDDDEDDHRDDEDPENDEERGVAGRRQRSGRRSCTSQGRGGVAGVTPWRHTAPMVLVAPSPLRPECPGRMVCGTAWRAGTGGAHTSSRRRVGPAQLRPRPGGRRCAPWLEDAAYDAALRHSDHAGALAARHRGSFSARHPEGHGWCRLARLVARLVHALFRQLCTASRSPNPSRKRSTPCGRSGDARRVADGRIAGRPTRDSLADTLAVTSRTSPPWCRASPRVDAPDRRLRLRSPWPEAGLCSMAYSTYSWACRRPALPRSARSGCRPEDPWARERRSLHYLVAARDAAIGTPPFRVALFESATGRYGVEDIREEHLRAMAAHIAAWLAHGEAVHGLISRRMLLRRRQAVEPSCWHAALADARSMLADLAVRRAGTGPFRITEHEVRVALSHEGSDDESDVPFAWTARTARRALGLAAIRLLARRRVALAARSGPGPDIVSRPAGCTRERVRLAAGSLAGGTPRSRTCCRRGRRGHVGDPPLVRSRLAGIRPTAGHRPRPLVGQPPFGAARPPRAGRGAHRRRAPGRAERGRAATRSGQSWRS